MLFCAAAAVVRGQEAIDDAYRAVHLTAKVATDIAERRPNFNGIAA